MSAFKSYRLWLLTILILATGLRFYRLGAQSFWYDEGNSARIAERSLRLIIEGAGGDIHPPMYYILLAGWRGLVGDSEFALRALSAICGVLTVLAVYLWGRAIKGVAVGLIAAFFVAVNPFAIYYSQEARMYALLALCASVSSWVLWSLLAQLHTFAAQPDVWQPASLSQSEQSFRLTSPPENRFFANSRHIFGAAMYVVATVAGLYTQYAYPFVLIAQGMGMLGWFYSYIHLRKFDSLWHIFRPIAIYGALNLIAIGVFSPWLSIALRQALGWGVEAQTYNLGAAILDIARWLVVGRTLPLDAAYIGIGLGAVLVIMALAPLKNASHTRISKDETVGLFLLLVVPIALLFVFKLYRDAYLKFLLVCVPPLCLLMATGFDKIIHRLESKAYKTAVWAVIFITNLWVVGQSLNNLYFNPRYTRDDYRAIAAMVQNIAQPGDAVLFNAPNQWEVFTYYHKPERETTPAIALKYRPNSEQEVIAHVKEILLGKRRLFVLNFAERESDPNNWYDKALAQLAYKAGDEWIGNIRLAVYAVANEPTSPSPCSASSPIFANALQLGNVTFTRPEALPVGEVLPIYAAWCVRQPILGNMKVFVHVGKPDAPPVAQNDAEPCAGHCPTSTWQLGAIVIDHRAVWLKPGTPPGDYSIFIGIYDPQTGQRLRLTATSGGVDDRLEIGKITIK